MPEAIGNECVGERIEELDAVLNDAGIMLETTLCAAVFLVGKAFRRYRAVGGGRRGVLPDFSIGAHAAVVGLPLLPRDVQRYRTYVPTITLIASEV